MKKIVFCLSILTLLLSLLCVAVCAVTHVVEWGSQSIEGEATYAIMEGTGGTTVYHNFDSVGYTYKNAQCDYTGAYFTTRIEKQSAIGIWVTQITGRGTVNSTVELGLGGEYGSGTYRFLITPKNSDGKSDGVNIYIEEFFSKSSTID